MRKWGVGGRKTVVGSLRLDHRISRAGEPQFLQFLHERRLLHALRRPRGTAMNIATHTATNTTTFTDTDVAALLRIAGEVNEIAPCAPGGGSADVHARRTHILQRLLGLIGGCWAVCSEIARRYLNDNGWAVPQSVTCAGELTTFQQDIVARYVTGRLGEVDPCIPPLLRRR